MYASCMYVLQLDATNSTNKSTNKSTNNSTNTKRHRKTQDVPLNDFGAPWNMTNSRAMPTDIPIPVKSDVPSCPIWFTVEICCLLNSFSTPSTEQMSPSCFSPVNGNRSSFPLFASSASSFWSKACSTKELTDGAWWVLAKPRASSHVNSKVVVVEGGCVSF